MPILTTISKVQGPFLFLVKCIFTYVEISLMHSLYYILKGQANKQINQTKNPNKTNLKTVIL